jgi:excisionase family DNA binding protein
LTVTEAAQTLQIEYDYCLRLIRAGRLKARKVKGRWNVLARSVADRRARIEEGA